LNEITPIRLSNTLAPHTTKNYLAYSVVCTLQHSVQTYTVQSFRKHLLFAFLQSTQICINSLVQHDIQARFKLAPCYFHVHEIFTNFTSWKKL